MAKSTKGDSKAGLIKTVTRPDGVVVDISESPLRAGPKDPSLTGNARIAVEREEARLRKLAAREQLSAFDENGMRIFNKHGGESSVQVSRADIQAATLLTHNHPRTIDKYTGEAEIGGTFSIEDIQAVNSHAAMIRRKATMRAVAAEGTYSITVERHSQQFVQKAEAAFEASKAKYETALQPYVNAFYAAGRTVEAYKDYARANNKLFNKRLQENHNWLMSHQKEFNYTYTLEAAT